MKRFTMYRRNVPDATHNADQKNPPDQPQFEGIQFSDGTVAIRWLTAKRSTAVWGSMEDMLAIHSHPEYGSELVWHDDWPAGAFAQEKPLPTLAELETLLNSEDDRPIKINADGSISIIGGPLG